MTNLGRNQYSSGAVIPANTKLIAALKAGRIFTAYQAAEFLGVSHQTTHKYLKTFHEDDMIVYVVRWDRPTGEVARGVWKAVYAWGNEDDAPRPVPLTNTEKVKRYYAREKAKRKGDPAAALEFLIDGRKRHASRAPVKTVEQIDPLLAILMGVRA